MSLTATILLALAMSTDAFAAAVAKGVGLDRPRVQEALRAGLIFGTIEAATPVMGWVLGRAAARFVESWDHWIAFGLLVGLGMHMIYAATTTTEEHGTRKQRHGFWLLVATAFATSIDAMAVGVSLAVIDVKIMPVAATIGFTTFALVTAGILLGRVLGIAIGKRAEIVGGLVLIGIGAAILGEHLSM